MRLSGMKRIGLAPIMALTIALAGCAGGGNTERDFLCKAEIGKPCATISESDGTSGSGTAIPVTETSPDAALKGLSQDPLTFGKAGGSGPLSGMPDGGWPYESGRYRVPEVIGRLWIAPYLDEEAILHESQYVHFVVMDAYWVEQ